MIAKLSRFDSATGVAILLLAFSIFSAVGGYLETHGTFDWLIIVSDFYANISAEFGSIAITVIVIDQLNRRREREERKLELFDQVKSRSNDMAVDALEKIQRAGWWDALLEYYPSDNEDYKTDLSRVQWAGGVQFAGVNLSSVNLGFANLKGANLFGANLEGTHLGSVNLKGANLSCVNLEGSNLALVDLEEAWLSGANFQKAWLGGANLTRSTLPDGTKWKEDTDKEQFTDPNHAKFAETLLEINAIRVARGFLPIEVDD